MKLFTYLALVGGINAYMKNTCRKFDKDILIDDFSLDDFSGQWYPILQSKRNHEVQGRCPVIHF